MLVAGDDPVDGLFDLRRGDGRLVSAGGQQRRFVHDAGQVSAGEPRRLARQAFEIHAGVEALASRVDLQDGEPADSIGSVHHHPPVEAPPTQKGGIEDIRPVGGPEDHHAGEAVEAVQLDQQVVPSDADSNAATAMAPVPAAVGEWAGSCAVARSLTTTTRGRPTR